VTRTCVWAGNLCKKNHFLQATLSHTFDQVIQLSQATRKSLGGGLVDHFKFLLTMGPTELDKEIKSRFQSWDVKKNNVLDKEEMKVTLITE